MLAYIAHATKILLSTYKHCYLCSLIQNPVLHIMYITCISIFTYNLISLMGAKRAILQGN